MLTWIGAIPTTDTNYEFQGGSATGQLDGQLSGGSGTAHDVYTESIDINGYYSYIYPNLPMSTGQDEYFTIYDRNFKTSDGKDEVWSEYVIYNGTITAVGTSYFPVYSGGQPPPAQIEANSPEVYGYSTTCVINGTAAEGFAQNGTSNPNTTLNLSPDGLSWGSWSSSYPTTGYVAGYVNGTTPTSVGLAHYNHRTSQPYFTQKDYAQ